MTYISEILLIFGGLMFILIGRRRKHKLITGIGIGALIAFIVLGTVDFIEGLQRGLSDAS